MGDGSKVADTLSTYFTRVGPDLANQIPKTNLEPEAYMQTTVESIFTFNITVRCLLCKIKTSKSLGPDKIPVLY